MPARVSIIICTANRAEHLRQTLESLAGVCIPAELPTEVVVVDNNSTYGTAALAQGYTLPNMPVRYVLEPHRGQCYARNAGIAASEAEIVVFTDDDLRFPPGWIESLCRPLLGRKRRGRDWRRLHSAYFGAALDAELSSGMAGGD